MKIQSNFFNNAAFAIDSKYYPQVKYYRDNKSTEQIHCQLELFNNGCLKYSTLINRLARLCNDSKQAINGIISQFLEPQTTVIFRKWNDGQIIALFPYDIWYRSDVSSYMTVGQHGGACYNGVIRETKPASREEYTELLKELQQIGYNLEVKQKYNHSKFLKAYYKAANIHH